MSGKIKTHALDRATCDEIIRIALPISLSEFGEKYGFHKVKVSQCIHAKRVHPDVREKLAEEIDVPASEIDDLLDEAKRRREILEAAETLEEHAGLDKDEILARAKENKEAH